jgi:hypothetical protein
MVRPCRLFQPVEVLQVPAQRGFVQIHIPDDGGELSGGTRHLTIDVSGLSFADSATVRALVPAART